ncbi:MAG: glycoside hydrolase/phage tail family protein [Pseudomonadota bacterium]
MATLVLQAAGHAAGSLLGPVGAMAGRAAGALAGHVVDQRLLNDDPDQSVGRIDDLTVQTSSEGNSIPKVYGRMRLAGTVIWSTDFVEQSKTSSGGKGGPKVTEYSYTVSFAVALCEGPIARIGRVWADGDPLDLTKITMRVYEGRGDQEADPLIEGIEGVAPAYRGLAYVVFEHLPIGAFGNRLPQLTFEVIRPVGDLEPMVRAVTLIPGATEFGYHPDEVRRQIAPGENDTDNRHLGVAASNLEASLDELLAVCPNLERIALVVAWFGDDLRAGECTLRPKVEAAVRPTDLEWRVGGLERGDAVLISTDAENRPAYGGTPSDNSVFAAIEAIKSRGIKVVFYPFILMDVPPDNGLTDPYGGAQQAVFPWRGRITVSPAPGRPGSPDGTEDADTAIAALLGTAAPNDFTGSDDVVSYSGPAEWSLRRMILHYARLCAQAGGVDAFLVGSELRGLSTVRGQSGYPFVSGLVSLVEDVRTVLGSGTKLSYAADWSEYFGHQPGNGDVTFHLDPFWASNDVDFIGIDNYWPLADWRDGTHEDDALAATPHDLTYLTGNITGGEGFDWYYASEADRINQVRTAISDGNYGKDWVFRYKDLKSWWSELHYNRVAGVEVAQPTDWVPEVKPVWFTEVGCPAVDKGANQPNVFYDPKSAESQLPYFSNGRRDDEMQRAYLEAMLGAFDWALSSDINNFNPISSVYGKRMVDRSGVHVWTWDARPFPAFPHNVEVWSDGPNWQRGHWLTGRLGTVPFGALVRALFADWGLAAPTVEAAPTVLDGFIVGTAQSLRNVLTPLTAATSVVGADTGVDVRFVGLLNAPVATIDEDDLVEVGGGALISELRDEVAALPIEQRIRYFDSGREYQLGSARFRPPEASTRQISEISIPASMNDGLATELAQMALAVRWGGRTAVRFSLPPSAIAIMPGDILTLRHDGRDREIMVEEVEDLGHREVLARTLDRTALSPVPTVFSPTPPTPPPAGANPVAFGVNLPLVDEAISDTEAFLAIHSRPFPTEMGIWRSVNGGSFTLLKSATQATSMGEVVGLVGLGPTNRWDYANELDVFLYRGTLQSADRLDVLDGENALAIEAANGEWEIVQFQTATLIGEQTYRLTTLLRGQVGTEQAARSGLPLGARVVVLDRTLTELGITEAQIGLTRTYRVGPLSDGVGGNDVTTFEFTPSGRARLPLSPVHGKARRRVSDNGLDLTWIRRTRIGGDGFPDGGDVPLGESEERYRLEILDSINVVRTVEVTSPLYTYSLAEQTADFGGALETISMRISQLAPGVGAGVPYEVTVNVEQP